MNIIHFFSYLYLNTFAPSNKWGKRIFNLHFNLFYLSILILDVNFYSKMKIKIYYLVILFLNFYYYMTFYIDNKTIGLIL
jgi:hypothetical protein